jgi:hypothetical protein
MKIARLEVESFQGAPDGVYDFLDGGEVSPMTVLTGRARSGKSSILAAIAAAKGVAAPTGVPPSAERVLKPGAKSGRLKVIWRLEEAEAELARTSDTIVQTSWAFSREGSTVDAPAGVRKLFARFSLAPEVSKLELIPEEWTTEPSRQLPEAPALRAQRASARADKYAWAPAALTQAMLGEAIAVRGRLQDQGMVVEGEVADATARYRLALLAVAPHLRIGPLVDAGDGPEPTFAAPNLPHGMRWTALAGSDRRALALTIAAVHLGLSSSLVLWDSPDRSFGAELCRPIATAMRQLLPEAQLVLTLDATSPPLEGAKVIGLSG